MVSLDLVHFLARSVICYILYAVFLYFLQVVEDSSLAFDYAFEQKGSIAANHRDMCKFSGNEDDGYCKIKDFLSLCLDRLAQG
jgi:hypothetical protein